MEESFEVGKMSKAANIDECACALCCSFRYPTDRQTEVAMIAGSIEIVAVMCVGGIGWFVVKS